MIRPPPAPTPTSPLFPYPTPFRSARRRLFRAPLQRQFYQQLGLRPWNQRVGGNDEVEAPETAGTKLVGHRLAGHAPLHQRGEGLRGGVVDVVAGVRVQPGPAPDERMGEQRDSLDGLKSVERRGGEGVSVNVEIGGERR